MKKTLFTLLIISAGVTASAQTPKPIIPKPVSTILLTAKQAISLDSMINVIAGQMDSKSATRALYEVYSPISKQVIQQAQEVPDKPKVEGKQP